MGKSHIGSAKDPYTLLHDVCSENTLKKIKIQEVQLLNPKLVLPMFKPFTFIMYARRAQATSVGTSE